MRAKKHLGQNFLVDPNVRRKILASCDLKKEDAVLEIGPGRGALTEHFVGKVAQVIAVEADRALAKELAERLRGPGVEIVPGDILKYDFSNLPKNTKVIGNIPYNISSPILERLIEHRACFTEAFLTVQLEFGQRLTANAGSKSYGSLSCFVQYYCDTNLLFKIKNSAFRPVPKVQSCFIRMRFRPPKNPAHDETFLFKMIRQAFQQRRKKIINALSPMASKKRLEKIFEQQGINGKDRAEDVTLEEYVRLADALAQD